MLEIIEYGKDEYTFPCLVVLGCFDAVHTGHRELFKKAKLQAKINGLDLGVMMFREGKGGKTLYSFEQRVKLLEGYNVKFVLAIDYNDDFKKTAPLDFLHTIEDKLNVKAYMSGKDFRFGAGAKGKSSTLKNYAEDEENGVWYMPIKDVTLGSDKISTTLIKSCLDGGDVKKAAELLGENYFVEGEVVKGAGRGAEILGYPTINLAYPENKYEVKRGVYKIKCTVGETVYDGVANFGTRPTFDDNETVLEAYLENCSSDLYGAAVKIEFIEFIRETYKLANAEELKAQLEADIATLHGAEPTLVAAPVEEAVATEPEVVEEAVVTEPAVVEEAVEPVEETAEAVVEEPVQETIEEVVEESVEEMVEEVVEEPVQETIEEVVEEPIQETVEEAVEESVETAEADGFDEFAVTEEEAENYTVEVVESAEPAEEIAEISEEVVIEEEVAEAPEEVNEISEEVVAEEVTEEFTEEAVCEEITEEIAEAEEPAEVTEEIVYEDPVDYAAEPAEEIPYEEITYATEEVIEEATETDEATEEFAVEEHTEEAVEAAEPAEEISEVSEEVVVEEIAEAPEVVAEEEVTEIPEEEIAAEDITETEDVSEETAEPAQEEIAEEVAEEIVAEEATEENDD